MNPTSLTKEQKQQWRKDYEHFHKSICEIIKGVFLIKIPVETMRIL